MATIYFVYQRKRAKRAPRTYPLCWDLVTFNRDYDVAVRTAEGLCRRHMKIETEPGEGLPKMFFGTDRHNHWDAMITTYDIFAKQKVPA